MTLLCVVVSCRPMVGSHGPDCPDPVRCKGCEPKLASTHPDKLQVCNACKTRVLGRLGDLPALDADLLLPSRVQGAAPPPEGPDDDTPATLAEISGPATDGALNVRAMIRESMVRWTRALRDDYQIPSPPTDGVTALMAHVDWHCLTLLADPQHAAQFAAEIDQLHADARRFAYPSPPPGQVVGDCPTCGTTLRSETAYGRIQCHGCGEVRRFEDWVALMLGDVSAESSATAPDLLAWLSARHERPITHTALRHWASKGVRLPKPDGAGNERVRLGRLGTDPYSRALYSVADAARIATGLYGPAKKGITA